jgi:hypothetical protein
MSSLPGDARSWRPAGEVERLLPQAGCFEGFLPVSEGLSSYRPPVLDREEESEAVTVSMAI